MTIIDPFVQPVMGMVDMLMNILSGGGGPPVQGNGAVGGTAPPGSVIITGLTHEQQLAHQAANKALSGTSTAAPTFVASQQIVAAATHTSVGVPTLPLTAQQRGIPTGLGYGTSLPPGGGGRGRAPSGGTGDATTQEQSGGGATSTSAGGGRGARRAV